MGVHHYLYIQAAEPKGSPDLDKGELTARSPVCYGARADLKEAADILAR
jgi:hypothetical protein